MSLLKTIYSVFILLLVVISVSCKKEITKSALLPKELIVYADTNVAQAIAAVSGEGVALLGFQNTDDTLYFKLINNDGSEIWTKSFDSISKSPSNMIVIADLDNTFSIFHGNSLTQINYAGDIVYYNRDFLKPIEYYARWKIILGNNNNYLVVGISYTPYGRGFVSEFSRTGQQKFKKIYASSANGITAFTSAIRSESGGYLLAGSFAAYINNPSITERSAFYLMEIDKDGKEIFVVKNDIDSCYCEGRDLFKLSNGNFAYLVSPVDQSSPDKRSRVYTVNDSGEVQSLDYIDFGASNFGVGSPFLGISAPGLVKNIDDSYFGLMRSSDRYWYSNYNVPTYSHYFTLDANAMVQEQNYLYTSYSNYYYGIAQLSNGHVLLFGHVESFGEKRKLSIIIK